MAEYRLYLLTSADRIHRPIALSCEDDDHAIAAMNPHIVKAAGAELWRGARLVRRVAPVPRQGPAPALAPDRHPSPDGRRPTGPISV